LNISKKISEHRVFKKKPIILMHIGSAGSDFKDWLDISKDSILISIDGNKSNQTDKGSFKKLINDKSIISYKNGKSKFFITKDPDCSSLLEPNEKELKNWYFSHRFKVKQKISTKVVSINSFLKKNKIDYLDWLVIDVQGMDLKIIKNLKNKIKNNLSIIDIEPGFFNFYKKEDKISDVFEYLSKKFEFGDMKFGYNFKLSNKNITKFEKKILFNMNNPSKVYSNIIFFNKNSNLRLILLKIFYLIKNDKLFEARHMISQCSNKDDFLKEISKEIDNKIRYKKIKYFLYLPFFLFKKVFNI